MRSLLILAVGVALTNASSQATLPEDAIEAIQNIADSKGPNTDILLPGISRLVETYGHGAWINFFESKEGLELREAIIAKLPESSKTKCVLNLKHCLSIFTEAEIDLLSKAGWRWMLWNMKSDFTPAKLAIQIITRDEPESISDQESDLYFASDFLKQILTRLSKQCEKSEADSCTELKRIGIKNSFTRAVTLSSLDATNIEKIFDLESGSLTATRELKFTLLAMKKWRIHDIYLRLRANDLAQDPSNVQALIPLLLTIANEPAPEAGGVVSLWEGTFILETLYNSQRLSQAIFDEVENTVGEAKLVAFLKSRQGDSLIGWHQDVAILKCYRGEGACSDPRARELMRLNGWIGSFRLALLNGGNINPTVLALTESGDEPVESRVDPNSVDFGRLEQLWYPKMIKDRANESDCRENVFKNYYTIGMTIKNRQDLGDAKFAQVMGSTGLSEEYSRTLNNLIEAGPAGIHKILVNCGMRPKDFKIDELLQELGKPTEFGLSMIELENLRASLSTIAGNAIRVRFHGERIAQALDKFGSDALIRYSQSDEGRATFKAAFHDNGEVLECLQDLSTCFKTEELMLLQRITWMKFFENLRVCDSFANLRSAIAALVAQSGDKGPSTRTIMCAEKLAFEKLVKEPVTKCTLREDEACQNARMTLSSNLVLQAIFLQNYAQFPPRAFARVFYGSDQEFLGIESREQFMAQVAQLGSVEKIHKVLLSYAASRYVNNGLTKPTMADFIDTFGPLWESSQDSQSLISDIERGGEVDAKLRSADAQAKLQCALNLSPDWKTNREKVITTVQRGNQIYGEVLAFLEGLPREARLKLFSVPDAETALATGNSVAALIFLINNAEVGSSMETLKQHCRHSPQCVNAVDAEKLN